MAGLTRGIAVGIGAADRRRALALQVAGLGRSGDIERGDAPVRNFTIHVRAAGLRSIVAAESSSGGTGARGIETGRIEALRIIIGDEAEDGGILLALPMPCRLALLPALHNRIEAGRDPADIRAAPVCAAKRTC